MDVFSYFCQVFEIKTKDLNDDQISEIKQFIDKHGVDWLRDYKEASELVQRINVKSKFTPHISASRAHLDGTVGQRGYYSEDSNYER